ncbi:MAG: hypothetical protein EOQ92_33210 [Mesorhizobium sp.]|nr:MAG: hypothetical protein EOQ92_33210 [Mesorhizobium sp.]RWK44726.1 MAG: hypothetical protein EOR47_34365 [Mesorhizobium sp.]RWK87947.1 MAG: hypothetical protein EOR53_34600 [Mesorhizobium sp.]TIP56424.1 MAG: hypothetical protein E5X56_24650 [Mesorhizobium sp.]TIQ23339.1 MAG: hypothetical protein E5X51_01535 [Mesorhizobium sp.]
MVYGGGGADPLKLKFDCSRCKPTVKITLLEVHPEHLPKRLMTIARCAHTPAVQGNGQATLVMPERWIESMIGSTVWANLSASRIEIFRPFAAASPVLVGLPSFIPVVLREARAALVRSEINRRSFSAKAE